MIHLWEFLDEIWEHYRIQKKIINVDKISPHFGETMSGYGQS